MSIKIEEVKTKKQIKEFIYLPEKIHKNHSTWLPPVYIDEWKFYNPKKNKAYEYSDTILYLAYKNNEPVGRIMGIINKKYNQLHNENYGRFFAMECYEDPEVFHALISKVEEWAKNKGVEKLIGPLGFSDKDPQGFQIEGFEHQTVVAMAANYPYMPKMLENEGYTKKVDLNDYIVYVKDELPEIYQRIYSRISNRNEIIIKEFNSKKELKDYIVPALTLMNELYAPIYGFVPLTEKEMIDLASQYLPVLDPHFVKMAFYKDELIGFIVGMPDISEGLKKCRGRIFPFGIFHLIKAMKKSTHIVLLLGGIKPEYRNNGVDVMMGIKMLESASAHGKKTIESHLILETNTLMIGEIEKAGGQLLKKFRIYQKDL